MNTLLIIEVFLSRNVYFNAEIKFENYGSWVFLSAKTGIVILTKKHSHKARVPMNLATTNYLGNVSSTSAGSVFFQCRQRAVDEYY